jgi:putative redox protein
LSSEVVHVEWVKDQVFLLRDHFNFPLVMAQPAGVNGADLLPLSIAGCAVWDILSILQKQHQNITGMRASAESVRELEPPWRFKRIHLRYIISGHDLNLEMIQRAVMLSETKYCSTLATLRQALEITSQVELVNQ